ncbi:MULTISPECIES: aminotransferase class I/II-fold pyridoxal phosphate-dependent enzyme [unclassified Saccharicrinis]|uniref:aminotransferase class I/II-fold pyridoxal phosphate-dependent enzyme n=1 Tax=unclassified Saccharicrinis TaxID=2646859 RepID=UPI003D33ABD6
MITHNTDNLTSPKAIIEYARETSLLNLAESHSYVKCNSKLEQILLNKVLPNANYPSPRFGLMDLRASISAKTSKLYDHRYDPETEVTITSGVKQSIFAAIMAFLKEGDEVLVFEPTHRSYEQAIETTGARPVTVTLRPPDFHVEWEEVQKLISTTTRMIIINSPHFPTGSTMSELDMIRLQKILNGTNIVVIADESFEHIVFDGEMHQSIALYPLLRERSIIVSSFNETLNIPNWHIGYCMASAKLTNELRKIIDIVGEGINLPYQMAIAEYINQQSSFNQLAAFYQKKRDLFLSIIEDSKIKAIPSKGTYFQLISFETPIDKSDVDMAYKLIREQDIATVPISFYYREKSKKKFLQINLSLSDEQIIDAANRLKSI